MTTRTVTITRDGEEIELLAEYERTPYFGALGFDNYHGPQPEEGGEAINLSVTLDGVEFELTTTERYEIYNYLDANQEDEI